MVRNKRIFSTVFAVVGTLGASFMIAYRLKSQPLRPPSALFNAEARPFIAEGVVRHFATGGDSGPMKVDQTTYARKSDWSWVEVTTNQAADGEVENLTTIWDVASGKRATLEQLTKSVMTYYLTKSQMQSAIAQTASCLPAVGSPTAEHKQMLGYEVVKVIEESPGPQGGKETIEAWVAPELGCYNLRRTESRSDGPHNEIEVTRLREGEPPAHMFDVPAEYMERSPSELSDEWEARFGYKFWRDGSRVKRMDDRYHAPRPGGGVGLK